MSIKQSYAWVIKLRRSWLVGLLAVMTPCMAHAEEMRFYKIEAAYLYNFFNYITWPGYASPKALAEPTICLDGDDRVAPYLSYVQTKMASERALKIRKLQSGEALTGCHIMFVRAGITRQMINDAVAAKTLLVAEPQDSLERGAMIELSQQDERLIIDIDQTLLSQQGFQISSRLLNLAQRIR